MKAQAVVEERSGEWFVKLVGPDAEVVKKSLTGCPVGSNPHAVELMTKSIKAKPKTYKMAPKRKANVYVENRNGDQALFTFYSGNRRIDYMQDLKGDRFVPPLDVQQRIAREIDAGKDEGEVGGFKYSTTGQKSSRVRRRKVAKMAEQKTTEQLADEVATKAKGISPGTAIWFVDDSGRTQTGEVLSVSGGNATFRDTSGRQHTARILDLMEMSLDKAVEDCDVPEPMQAAVKAIALKKLKAITKRPNMEVTNPQGRSIGLEFDDKYGEFAEGSGSSIPSDVKQAIASSPRGGSQSGWSWRGKNMKRKSVRKCWISKSNKKHAWLLKSDGDPLTPEEEEQLQEMGVEDVSVEEKEPDLVEWAEQEIQEPEHKARGDIFKVGDRVTDGELDGEVIAVRGTTIDVKWSNGQTQRDLDFEDVRPKAIDSETVEEKADDVVERAEEIVEAGAEPEDAVDAAIEEKEVPPEEVKAVKRLAMKRIKRKQLDDSHLDDSSRRQNSLKNNEPVGLRALKAMIKAIEDEKMALHKSEQPHVLDGALKLLKAALKRHYKEADVPDPDALQKGKRFKCKGKSYVCKAVEDEVIEDKDVARVVESNTGEFFLEDAPGTGGRESYDNGPFDSRAEALAKWRELEGKSYDKGLSVGDDVVRVGGIYDGDVGVVVALRGDLADVKWTSRRDTPTTDVATSQLRKKSVSKRLSKADTDVVQSAIDDLESMEQGTDTPKHHKGTLRKMVEDLKGLTRSKGTIDDPEVFDEVTEGLERACKRLDASEKRISDRVFQETGLRIN